MYKNFSSTHDGYKNFSSTRAQAARSRELNLAGSKNFAKQNFGLARAVHKFHQKAQEADFCLTFKAAMYYTFNMIVLGIDPGYAIIGFGLIDTSKNNKVIDYGVITTPKEDSIAIRLKNIESALCSLFEAYHPDAVAVEELFYFKNQKTVIPVAEARGVILLTAQKFCENIFEYTPMQIKQALTGQGRAEKKQIQFMVKSILGLKEVPKPDDAADALAVALTHAQTSPRLNTNRV